MCGKTWFCEEPVRVCGTLGAPPAAGGDGKKLPPEEKKRPTARDSLAMKDPADSYKRQGPARQSGRPPEPAGGRLHPKEGKEHPS